MPTWDDLAAEFIAIMSDRFGTDSKEVRDLRVIRDGDPWSACECAIAAVGWYDIIVPDRIIEMTRELCADALDFTEYDELMEAQEEARKAHAAAPAA
ncbi:hypothetical protein CWT12_06480 [Actinomyces sp. 432]|uniref:hypothetical protein n=1 Tax=Actinomyces sp. 432 TaxID=2057798 RepID=UPI00137393C4|nr:hypothetical protein [Actinomyces sp. 432]QHO91034.1 hypothetical protein CWT12_06480 [Actinomyces sp. 432]